MLTKVSFGLVYISMAPGFIPAGEYMYVPDLASTRLLSFTPGTASVMGWFEEKELILGPNGQDTFKAALCPRDLLRRLVA